MNPQVPFTINKKNGNHHPFDNNNMNANTAPPTTSSSSVAEVQEEARWQPPSVSTTASRPLCMAMSAPPKQPTRQVSEATAPGVESPRPRVNKLNCKASPLRIPRPRVAKAIILHNANNNNKSGNALSPRKPERQVSIALAAACANAVAEETTMAQQHPLPLPPSMHIGGQQISWTSTLSSDDDDESTATPSQSATTSASGSLSSSDECSIDVPGLLRKKDELASSSNHCSRRGLIKTLSADSHASSISVGSRDLSPIRPTRQKTLTGCGNLNIHDSQTSTTVNMDDLEDLWSSSIVLTERDSRSCPPKAAIRQPSWVQLWESQGEQPTGSLLWDLK